MIFSIVLTFEAVDEAAANQTREIIDSAVNEFTTLGPVDVSAIAEVAPLVAFDEEGDDS